MRTIAYTILTAPVNFENRLANYYEGLTDRQIRRLRLEWIYRRQGEYRRARDKVDGLSMRTILDQCMSSHPHLGYVCGASIASFISPGDRGGATGPGETKAQTWYAISPGRSNEEEDRPTERDLLRAFWSKLEQIANQTGKAQWVSWRGKKFEIPFLRQRSILNEVQVPNIDAVDDYPWSDNPNFDLTSKLSDDRMYSTLGDAAAFFGVEDDTLSYDESLIPGALRDKDTEYIRQAVRLKAKMIYRLYRRVNSSLVLG